MVELKNYAEYGGDHWELAALRNVLAHQGERLPHNGEAPSEALLLGIAGGIVAGYFIFQYQGYPPLFNFLTVQSFDPLTNALERLQIEAKNLRTHSAEKARLNLTQALADGNAPLVWADAFSLGYGDAQWGEENWFVIPILVTRYDEAADEASIVDRAHVPIEIPAHQLDAARQRIRKERQRVMTLGKIQWQRLPAAIHAGIQQCLDHATGEPPRKPMRGKYGLAAYTRWADALADERSKTGWKRQFTQGSERFALITNFYHYTHHFGTGGKGARGRYADFLVEAAAILEQDALRSVAPAFRQAERRWEALYDEMLSADLPPLFRARQLMNEREGLFRERGSASTEERKKINAQLEALRVEADETLAFTESEERSWRLGMREAVLALQDQETSAFQQLQEAMAEMEV
ncbi:MAG: DUF4872 domain-containing protein [Anaerolineaceae bacterium]|nr:DUF4872 domain-containing protein [Anaerolineaceae bacterium]